MAFLRKRASGNYPLSFKWKGKSYIKALGTDDEQEAEQIKKDAEGQIARIRRGESALASRLLAEGFSIVDVLFGSPEIASRLTETAEGNPPPMGGLLNGYVNARDCPWGTMNPEQFTSQHSSHCATRSWIITRACACSPPGEHS